MRGKDAETFPIADLLGITPAYAGKSLCLFCASIQTWDHPRLCGEKAAAWRKIKMEVGSPPPMRGKAASKMDINFFFRITPAYAGKREVPAVPFLFFRDHPRLCGEKYDPNNEFDEEYGSPPPMRGKVCRPAS